MEIRIIDNAGINQFLDFDLKREQKKIEFYTLTTFIKDCFKTQFNKIHDLVPYSDELVIKVHLEQEKQIQDTLSTSTVLACFDREFSHEKEYVFRLYYPTIKEIAFYLISENESSINSSEFNNTILHELLHTVDIVILKETLNAHLHDCRIGKNQFDFLSENVNMNKLNSGIQWAFLGTVELFRNEGITVLGEKLLGSSKVQSEFQSEFDISSYFKNLLTYAIQMSINSQFSSVENNYKIFDEIRSQSLMAYHIGDFILVKLIGKLDPELENISQKTIQYLLGKSEMKPTEEEVKALLKYAFQMDLTDYINALINCHHEDINTSFMSKENLFKLCAAIQNEHNPVAIEVFSKNNSTNSNLIAKTLYLKLMQSTVYSCMTNVELTVYCEQFILNPSSEDIVSSIKEQVAYLLPLAIENNNEIAQWALTYLFDEEDLIFDNMSLLGWQDDWMVLDTAVQLIQNEDLKL
jgi:hypothetical protein